MELALENGVNFHGRGRRKASLVAYGRAAAAAAARSIPGALRADYRTGKYGWTLELEDIKRSVAWQLDALKTDYIDFGFLHCIDETADLEKAERTARWSI